MPALRTPQKFLERPQNGEIRVPDWRCIDELVRNLVRQFSDSGPETTVESEQILVDTEVDGARYLLVRLAIPSHAGPSLSPREQEIVRMVSQGLPNKVIAGVLNISSWTVSTHLRRIFAKLGVTSRAAMVAQSLEGCARPRMSTLAPVGVNGRCQRFK